MSAKERALKDLIEGKDFESINKENSTGTVYRAFQDWINWAKNEQGSIKERVNEYRKREAEANSEARAAEIECEKIQAHLLELRSEENENMARLTGIKQQALETENRLVSLKQEESETIERIEKLVKKGYTQENLDLIIESDAQNSNELLQRVKTSDQYISLRDELEQIESERNFILSETETEKNYLEEIKEAKKSVQNELDELKSQHSSWVDCIQFIIKSQRKNRFTIEILKELVDELARLSIVGEPQRSAERVLSRMKKVSEEIELDEAIKRKTSQVASLEEKLQELAGTFDALKNGAIRPIEESHRSFEKSLDAVTSKAIQELSKVQVAAQNSVNELAKTAIASINTQKFEGEIRLKNTEKALMANTITLLGEVQTKIVKLDQETREWGDIREQVGRLDYYLKHSIIIFGPLASEEAILALDPQLVRHMIHRLHLYIKKKFPDVKTNAPKYIAQKELGISDFWPITLTSISELLTVELDRLLTGE